MIIDRQLLLSNAQAVTVTAVSTNTIDLTVARYDGFPHTAVGTFTAGAITAGIAMYREGSVNYDSGLNTNGF